MPRYGYRRPPLEPLQARFERERHGYLERIGGYLRRQDRLREIPLEGRPGDGEPAWRNDFLPPLDAVALYGTIAEARPVTYLEVGSGNSTRFARRAIRDHALPTRIVSIDPEPRAEIDDLCDEVIRLPLQEVEPARIPRLEPGDVLFVDGSHRATMDSDVVVVMLELLPSLPPGVIVQIHDVYLPNDYPPQWVSRDYSEQYLLAAQMIVKPEAFEVLMPCFFVTHDRGFDLDHPLWAWLRSNGLEIHGESFWFRTR